MNPHEITVELVQQMLRTSEKDSTIVVLPCLKVEELDNGFHAGSSLSRVTVKYTRSGSASQHTLSLIVKVVSTGNSRIGALQLSTLFPREIQMFSEILPRMSSLLSQALADRHAEFAARVYYTRKTPNYLIAVEDLSPKGFNPPKRKGGLDLKHCKLAFKAIARFHAASVIIHYKDKDLFDIFNTYYMEESNLSSGKTSAKFISMVAQEMKSRPEFEPTWGDRLCRRYKTLHEDLRAAWKRDDNSFNVLNHGDFAIHNVMYRYSESSGEVEAIMLVDFQCCSYNSPVIDLHQFLFVSASDDVRANHVGTLLKEYHAELTATLESMGGLKDKTISLEQLLEEFDRKLLYGFFCATCLLPFLRVDIDPKTDINNEDMSKVNANTIGNFRSLVTDSYLTSLRIMIPTFIQKNII